MPPMCIANSGYNFVTQVNLDDYADKPFLRLQGAQFESGPLSFNISQYHVDMPV
jgi:hypothetical protein